MQKLTVAFSSCPNDTFIFYAMINQLIDCGDFHFLPHIDDIDSLNKDALLKRFPITKLSFFTYFLVKHGYELLDSGAALGYGCGPVLVARTRKLSFSDARIAIPGRYTTAHLLLRLWNSGIQNVKVTRFDRILPGVESGKFDAGVIIHEGRFILPNYNCVKIVDLGQWWEDETGLPIPLGCIAIRKGKMIRLYKRSIETILKDSILYAVKNPEAPGEYVRSYAQEMEEHVIDSHIRLYVNDFTLSLGPIGRNAVKTLEKKARCLNLL